MKKILSIILIALLMLGGCQSDNERNTSDETNADNVSISENTEDSSDKDQEPINNEDKISNQNHVENIEGYGTLTENKISKDINQLYKSGPFEVNLNGLVLFEYEPDDEFSEFLNGDIQSALYVQFDVENTSDETLSIYPDQSVLTTNTKEQVYADIISSESIGGDFIGKVIKSGMVVYYLESSADDINSIKITIEGPHNENFDSVGEIIAIEHEF